MVKLETIQGVHQAHADLLREMCAINSVAALLKAGATPEGRESLAAALNVPPAVVLDWVHQADMSRVKGVGRGYLSLLNALGIRTLAQLRQQVAENLYARMCECNKNHRLVRRSPTLEMVSDWIEQAGELTPTVSEQT